jgi:site-specific DNA recombinase
MDRKITVSDQFGNAAGEKKSWICAGYARVSTEYELQSTSFQEQIQYLENKIKSDPDKTFAGVYADRGSGRSTNERPEFLRMMEDARAGKFDMILCKSVSRFGRNLADFTEHMRELRRLGIRVCFEKESLDSSNPRMDFLLNIFEVLAQEESNSQSENLKWAYEKRLIQGNPVTSRASYGYRREEREWVPDGKRADRVKMVFEMFLAGKTCHAIGDEIRRRVQEEGDDDFWDGCKVLHILQNQNYTGDYVAFQTVIYKNPVTGKKASKLNEGERPKFVIQDHHEALVSRDDFWKAQKKLGKNGVKKPTEQKKLHQEADE